MPTLLAAAAPALRLTALSTLTLGLLWPAAITTVAGVALADPAAGSVVARDGAPVGSLNVGQAFSADRHLWGRPSATATPYDASASSGSNLGPNHPALQEAVEARARRLRDSNPQASGPIPLDLVTTSASGLDPHVSPAAAAWQVSRLAASTGRSPQAIVRLIDGCTEGRWLGVFGEPRVHVLCVNLALDAAAPQGQEVP